MIAPLPSSYDTFVLAVVVAAVVLTVLSGSSTCSPSGIAWRRGEGRGRRGRDRAAAGTIANTNARWMSERLAAIGADVLHHQAVGTTRRIVEAIRLAASRADVAILTGGLGPTQDDITRDALGAVGDADGAPPELEELLREKFRSFGRREMPESNLRQADVPEGVRYIEPSRGTAPGLVADLRRACVYAVPGVPEMVEMMEGTILPELAALGTAVVRSQGPAVRRDRRVGTGRARRRPVHRVGEPHDRVPRVLRRGEGADHGQGGETAEEADA